MFESALLAGELIRQLCVKIAMHVLCQASRGRDAQQLSEFKSRPGENEYSSLCARITEGTVASTGRTSERPYVDPCIHIHGADFPGELVTLFKSPVCHISYILNGLAALRLPATI